MHIFNFSLCSIMVNILIIVGLKKNQVVRCCLEHAASVAKTFLTSDAVVVDIKELDLIPRRKPMPPMSPMPPVSPLPSPGNSAISRRKPMPRMPLVPPLPTSGKPSFTIQVPTCQ